MAPLPGLHQESLEEAEGQLRMIGQLLQGQAIPRPVVLMSGRMNTWLISCLGHHVAQDLYPSVRFGLECALLSAMAQLRGVTLKALLLSSVVRTPVPLMPPSGTSDPSSWWAREAALVGVNGLLSSSGSVREAVEEGQKLVAAGYRAIKVKVGRRLDPREDAEVLCELRKVLGPRIVLRADANRAWSLDQAVTFGLTARHADLQYIEEPTADPVEMTEFYVATGINVAVDESLDEGRVGPGPYVGGGRSPDVGLPPGLTAAVIKPSVVGGLEAAWDIILWCCRCGVVPVVSSAFESTVGVALMTQLAAAADQLWSDYCGGSASACHAHDDRGGTVLHMADSTSAIEGHTDASAGVVHCGCTQVEAAGAVRDLLPGACQGSWHGLGTLQWFSHDVVSPALKLYHKDHGGGVHPEGVLGLAFSVDSSWKLLQNMAAGAAMRTGRGLGAFKSLADSVTSWEVEVHSGGCPYLLHCVEVNPVGGGVVDRAENTVEEDSVLDKVTWQVGAREDGPEGMRGTCAADEEECGGCSPKRPMALELRPADPTKVQTFPGEGPQPPPPDQVQCADVGHAYGTELEGGAGRPSPSAYEGQDRGVGESWAASCRGPVVVLLHGFLGASRDWLPVMQGLAPTCSCIAVDLPCHGATPAASGGKNSKARVVDDHLSVESAQAVVAEFIRSRGLQGAIVVGYSLGARVALSLGVHHPGLCGALVCVSGTPGIPSSRARLARQLRDDTLAALMAQQGLAGFLRYWYDQSLWCSLRSSASFPIMFERRMAQANGEDGLAAILVGMSTGRMVSLWGRLQDLKQPVKVVVGAEDKKFVILGLKMVRQVGGQVDYCEVAGVGHAVHLESPGRLIQVIRQALGGLQP